MTQQMVDALADRVELRASYGLSECAQLNFTRQLMRGDSPKIVGRPSDTTKAYILEPNTTKMLGAGRAGELCLAGPQIAAGYYHRPSETDASFIENPFGSGKLYRTGDQAIRHRDSTFEITGRIDYQLKIYGQRLEPEEVTARLGDNQVVMALTTVGAVIKERTSLVAAVVPKPETTWTEVVHSLRNHAEHVLAPYMMPSYWLQLDSLPTNANGKVDIKAIRQLAESSNPMDMLGFVIGDNNDSEPPSNDYERACQVVWAETLKLDIKDVTRSSSFTALGGSSMDAIRVVQELRARGILVELGDILRSRRLSDIPWQEAGSDLQTISRDPQRLALVTHADIRAQLANDRDIFDAYPVTQLQGSLLASTLQGNLDYLYQRTYDIRHLDLQKLKLAFALAFRNSDILRTTFITTEAGMLQVVRNDFQLPWKHVPLPLTEFKAQDRQQSVEFGKPFARFTVINKQLLVVSMHHSLFDFWSHRFLYDDVARLFLGLEPIHRQPFRKYVNYLLNQSTETADAFWKSYLEQAQPSLILHSPGKCVHTGRRNLAMDLKASAQGLGVTSGSLIYTAWAIILARHTGLAEAVFATAIAGREIPLYQVASLDGPTLTVVPQRVVLDPKATLRQAVKTVHDSFWEVLKYSQHGMRHALSASSQQTSQLFDTMVNILVKDGSTERYSDQVFQQYGPKPSWQTEWGTLDIEEEREGLQLRFSAPMPQRRIDFILEELTVVLTKIVEDASENIEVIDPVGEAEREWLSSADYSIRSKPSLLHDRFEKMAQRYPASIALQWQTKEGFTYRQLDMMSNQMAAFLGKNGVKPGTLVPLLLSKSPNLIIAILALLKLGAAYVPLSPENPVERNAFILQETKAVVVLSELEHQGTVAELRGQILMLDQVDLSRFSPERTAHKARPSELAYVLYTSGSTGRPKGVMVEHQSAAAAIDSIIHFEGLEHHHSKTLQFSNYVFDVSVYDIFVTLGSGDTLCLAPQDRLLSDLQSVIREMEVSHCFLTPTVARLLEPEAVPSLKSLTVGGEAVTPDIIQKWSEGHSLKNGYGPTETSILATMKTIDPDTNAKDIGKPLPTLKAFIIDPNGHRLVPWGAIGEICCSGPQLAQGYLGRQEQTAAAFFDYGIEGVSRIYRTGDLGRWLTNGDIEYLGRKDNQIKINGYRVELGEIEQAILQADSVKDAAVIVADINGKGQLLAYVVFKKELQQEGLTLADFEDEVMEIREALKRVAHYMVPKYVMPQEGMPKLPSGKTNRKDLVATANAMSAAYLSKFSLNASSAPSSITRPETEEQRVLQQSWASVLQINAENFGIEADFLALGGDSISAINLASHLRRQGYNISVGDALASTILKDMAACVIKEDGRKSDGEGKVVEPPPEAFNALLSHGVKEEDFEYLYICPPGQAEFLAQGAKSEQYWAVMTVRELAASADVEDWISTAKKLAETNEILRTTFVECEGSWYGAVLKAATPIVERLDISNEQGRKDHIERVWQTRFKPGEPYLLYSIMSWPDGKLEVIVKMDHGLYDGTLLRIFDSHFKGYQHNEAQVYTPFRDFATQTASSNKARSLKFWTDDARKPTSFRYPRSSNPSITATQISTNTLDLASLNQTPSIIFQAAYQIFLSRHSHRTDVTFDYLYTGRNVDLPSPQSINGNCANFLPLRAQLDPSRSLKSYLAETNTSFWRATEHSNVGLQDIYSAAGLNKEEHTNTALFLFQPFDPPAKQGDEMKWVVMAKSEVRMPQPYALVFEVVKMKEGWKFKIGYDRRTFNGEEAEHVAEELEQIVKGLLEFDSVEGGGLGRLVETQT